MAKSKKSAAGGEPVALPEGYVPRMKTRYEKSVRAKIKEKLGIQNDMAVPRLTKICLNMGFGRATTQNNPKVMEQCVADMTSIAGQKAVITLSKQAISNFKLREGMKVGCRVTLRGARMWEFFDRLVSVAVPRMRDFRGLSPKAFDGRGNYSMGLNEQTIFPEIDPDKVTAIVGMDITIVTNAGNDEHARELLREMGMPFRER